MNVQLKKKMIVVSQKYQISVGYFKRNFNLITELLNQCIGTSLSEIRDMINFKQDENIITNKEVNLLLVRKLQSITINTIKSAATEIRKSLNESTFSLKNKFCDAEELKNSWNNVHMPHELIYFFSHLFNIPQSYLCNYQVNAYDMEDDDDVPDVIKRKVMKIKSPYQILYYNLHSGKEKTPIHLFTGNSVYEKC